MTTIPITTNFSNSTRLRDMNLSKVYAIKSVSEVNLYKIHRTFYILSISMSKKRESQEIFVNVVVQTLRMRYGTDVKSLSESTPTLRMNSCLGVLSLLAQKIQWLFKIQFHPIVV